MSHPNYFFVLMTILFSIHSIEGTRLSFADFIACACISMVGVAFRWAGYWIIDETFEVKNEEAQSSTNQDEADSR